MFVYMTEYEWECINGESKRKDQICKARGCFITAWTWVTTT